MPDAQAKTASASSKEEENKRNSSDLTTRLKFIFAAQISQGTGTASIQPPALVTKFVMAGPGILWSCSDVSVIWTIAQQLRQTITAPKASSHADSFLIRS